MTAEGSPITSYLAGKVILKAEGDNIIDAKQTAVNLWNGMEASLSAKVTNVISAENSTGAQLDALFNAADPHGKHKNYSPSLWHHDAERVPNKR